MLAIIKWPKRMNQCCQAEQSYLEKVWSYTQQDLNTEHLLKEDKHNATSLWGEQRWVKTVTGL
jgi:hypothetical protein